MVLATVVTAVASWLVETESKHLHTATRVTTNKPADSYTGVSAAAPAALAAEVAGWLEWEESVLRPAVYLSEPSALPAALAHLAAALAGREFLAGGALTLADVAVFATLLPLTMAPAMVRRRTRAPVHFCFLLTLADTAAPTALLPPTVASLMVCCTSYSCSWRRTQHTLSGPCQGRRAECGMQYLKPSFYGQTI